MPLRWKDGINPDTVLSFSDYESFNKFILSESTDVISKDQSFSMINGGKVTLDKMQLVRKSDYQRQVTLGNKDEYAWWKKDGLYYKYTSVFPSTLNLLLQTKRKYKNLKQKDEVIIVEGIHYAYDATQGIQLDSLEFPIGKPLFKVDNHGIVDYNQMFTSTDGKTIKVVGRMH